MNGFYVNLPFPHPYRHWEIRRRKPLGDYWHWWTTAVNSHGFALDRDWFMDDPLPKKGWWEEETT